MRRKKPDPDPDPDPEPDRTGFAINDATIREHADAKSLDRGRRYVEDGCVGVLVRRGDEIEAEVDGSDAFPYLVSVSLGPASITGAHCTCPYEWGGWCKHIVAVLLTMAADPDAAEDRPSLDALLDAADADQLRAALRGLVAAGAVTTETVASALARANPPPVQAARTAAMRTPISDFVVPVVKTARRDVRDGLLAARQALSNGEYWEEPIDLGGRDARETVAQLLRDGDADAALAVLDGITDEYASLWSVVDDEDGLVGGIVPALDPLWAETLLSLDLSEDERADWAEKLQGYAAGFERHGEGDRFDAALLALREGWTGPAISQLLTGEPLSPSDGDPWNHQGEEEDDDTWDDLDGEEDDAGGPRIASEWDTVTEAWLTILDRRGRTDDYLAVAAALGRVGRRAHMLLRLDRPAEALGVGLAGPLEPDETLALAIAFMDRGDPARALLIADRGQTLIPDNVLFDQHDMGTAWTASRTALAVWTRDHAREHGNTALALCAARAAFEGDLGLTAYLHVHDLAGDSWETLKPKLLDRVGARRAWYVARAVDIYLHENMIDEAIATVDSAYDWEPLARVMDAALLSHPDWVASVSRKRAAEIMDGGKSGHYAGAVAWLRRTGDAEKVRGNTAAWRAELDGLIRTHTRKYKLRPMLEELRRRV